MNFQVAESVLKFIPTDTPRLEVFDSFLVMKGALDNSLLSKGKKIRPLLVLLSAQLQGFTPSEFEDIALCAELIHAASLAHDDVIDNANQRRSQPSLNSIIGNRQSVLIGDLLFTDAINRISRRGHIKLICKTVDTITELVKGELLQNDLRGRIQISEYQLNEVMSLKTSSLIVWCLQAPAILANSDLVMINQLEVFGRLIGSSFQKIDDVLDFTTESGKEFAKDLKEGLVNAVIQDLLYREPELIGIFKEHLGKDTAIDLCRKHIRDIQISCARLRTKTKLDLKRAEDSLHSLYSLVTPKNNTESKIALESFENLLNELKERTV